MTAAKIEELKKALPKCKIEWDGGVIEPRVSTPTARPPSGCCPSAGRSGCNDQEPEIKAAADLPRRPFRLTGVV